MDTAERQHVILGAGPLGFALGQQLQAANTPARLYSIMGNRAYDMLGTRPQVLDGSDETAVTAACGSAAVVYLLLNTHYAEVAEMLYQFDKPLAVSHQKYKQAFGATPTPHRQALRQTLAWYRENPQR